MNMRTTAILAGVLTTAATVQAAIVITEVAPSGSTGQCDSEDWIELHNDGDAAVDLAGYKLHDDKGVGDGDTFTFPASSLIAADEFKLLCKDATESFQFGIGKSDQVTLLDASGTVVDTTGALPGVDFDENDVPIYTWARVDDDGDFAMLRYPSPGASNEDMQPAKFQVFINEVADKGTDMNPGFACNPAADYIELYNAEPAAIDITGWKIHDDNGADGEDAYIHASNHTTTSIPSKGFLLLCGEDKSVDPPTFQDFKFGIGSDDAITLIDAAGNVIDTTGTLTKRGDATTVWGRTEDGGGVFTYLSPPTPGATNAGMDYKPAGETVGNQLTAECQKTKADGGCEQRRCDKTVSVHNKICTDDSAATQCTLDECEQKCKDHTDFTCSTYAYDVAEKECYLFETCVNEQFDADYSTYVLQDATNVPSPPPPLPSPPPPPKLVFLTDNESSAGRVSVLTALVVSLLSAL